MASNLNGHTARNKRLVTIGSGVNFQPDHTPFTENSLCINAIAIMNFQPHLFKKPEKQVLPALQMKNPGITLEKINLT